MDSFRIAREESETSSIEKALRRVRRAPQAYVIFAAIAIDRTYSEDILRVFIAHAKLKSIYMTNSARIIIEQLQHKRLKFNSWINFCVRQWQI